MKNRILSFVLALVMVLALVPAAVVSSAAAEHGAINVTMGTVTGAPGEVVLVPMYVQIADLQGAEGLVNFQGIFEVAEGLTLNVGAEVPTTAGSANTFVNADGTIGTTADPAFDAFLNTADVLAAKGGVAVIYVAVEIGEDVADGTVLSIGLKEISVMKVGSYTAPKTLADFALDFADYTTNFVAGSVTVSTAGETNAPANSDEVDFYAVPEYVDGAKVTSITKNGKLGGTYGTLYIPASVTSVKSAGFKCEATNVILKNTDAFDGYTVIGDAYDDGNVEKIYLHRLANGTDSLYDALADEYDVELINILGGGVVATGNDVTAYGVIRVEDLAYDYVTVEVTIGDRTFEADFTGVATTLTHKGTAVVSTSAGAIELGAADGEGVYLFGLTVTGVPAGTYDVAVNVYGSTASSNGTSVIVCCDGYTTTVTV